MVQIYLMRTNNRSTSYLAESNPKLPLRTRMGQTMTTMMKTKMMMMKVVTMMMLRRTSLGKKGVRMKKMRMMTLRQMVMEGAMMKMKMTTTVVTKMVTMMMMRTMKTMTMMMTRTSLLPRRRNELASSILHLSSTYFSLLCCLDDEQVWDLCSLWFGLFGSLNRSRKTLTSDVNLFSCVLPLCM